MTTAVEATGLAAEASVNIKSVNAALQAELAAADTDILGHPDLQDIKTLPPTEACGLPVYDEKKAQSVLNRGEERLRLSD